MKLFQVQYDGQYLYLLAEDFGEALEKWRYRMLLDSRKEGWEWDQHEDPEQVIVISDSESELHFPETTSIPGTKSVHAVITPTCRTNKGAGPAWSEAIRRLRTEYEALLALSINQTADFHVALAVERKKKP